MPTHRDLLNRPDINPSAKKLLEYDLGLLRELFGVSMRLGAAMLVENDEYASIIADTRRLNQRVGAYLKTQKAA